jgi:hypothetical protein
MVHQERCCASTRQPAKKLLLGLRLALLSESEDHRLSVAKYERIAFYGFALLLVALDGKWLPHFQMTGVRSFLSECRVCNSESQLDFVVSSSNIPAMALLFVDQILPCQVDDR